jgi:hypothetical protein
MREIRTSGSMSGTWKRSASRHRATSRLYPVSLSSVGRLACLRATHFAPPFASFLRAFAPSRLFVCAVPRCGLAASIRSRFAPLDGIELAEPMREPMPNPWDLAKRMPRSPRSHAPSSHDSGPTWLATPSSHETFIHCTSPALPAHRVPFEPPPPFPSNPVCTQYSIPEFMRVVSRNSVRAAPPRIRRPQRI